MSRNRAVTGLVQLGIIAGFVLLWHYVTSTGKVSQIFLPTLPAFADAFVTITTSGAFIRPLQVTLFQFAVAYSGALVAGTLTGYLIGRSDMATRVMGPLFSSLFAVPLIVFYPLALLFFGLGPGSKIAVGFAMGFFPIVLNTIAGFSSIEPQYRRVAYAMGARGFMLFRHLLLPAALPVILTGFRIGFILCFLSIIGGETLGSLQGLGHQIVFHAESLQMARMFAYIVYIVTFAFLVLSILFWIERKWNYMK